jgi:hypothetical protein
MNKLILILVFLLTPLVSLAETLQTNVPGVTVKNFQCSGGNVTFNVVNKSSRTLGSLYINIFDSENDPIDKIWVDLGYLTANSGKEYSKSVNCSKLTRVGITVY